MFPKREVCEASSQFSPAQRFIASRSTTLTHTVASRRRRRQSRASALRVTEKATCLRRAEQGRAADPAKTLRVGPARPTQRFALRRSAVQEKTEKQNEEVRDDGTRTCPRDGGMQRQESSSAASDAGPAQDASPSPTISPSTSPSLSMMSSKSSSSTSSSSFIASAKEDGESAAHRVGVAYCESFALHASPRKGHEERPARLDAIVRKLHSLGLWERASRIPVRDASDDELMSIHTKGYVRKLARIERQCKDATSAEDKDAVSALCEKFTLDHEDVYLNGHSVACARRAVGACLESVRALAAGEVSSAIALVRPPGHHAEAHCAQGFCIFNNVALAAKHAVDTLGLARVLVVDWDVHHGNGTQHAFYKDPRVMYFSVHRFDFGRYYPSLESAGPMSVGCGLAAGTNVNVAWNGHGIGDAEYLMAWENVLMPIAREFRPEMVIVSAGFDAAEGDRMGRCKVSPQGFAAMTRELQSLAQGRMLLVLEGGYELSSLSDSFAACAHELFGCTSEQDHEARVSRIRSSFVRPEAVKAVEASVRAQKPYWSSLASVGRTLS